MYGDDDDDARQVRPHPISRTRHQHHQHQQPIQIPTHQNIHTQAGSFTAGLIPVDNNGSQIFYWYCPPTTTNRTAAAHAPTILWLQGGPGASGLVGALYEMGPYKLEVKVRRGWFPAVFACRWRMVGIYGHR